MLAAHPAQAGTLSPAEAAGKRIYREGLLPSGEPLRGTVNGVALSGAAAACAGCHRRSGLGGGEGQNTVRPIAGKMLFESLSDRSVRASALSYGAEKTRPAYTAATLARALRVGIDPAGRTLDVLMPRFDLGDEDVMQLAAYLKQLAPVAAPGVDGSEIHFATIIAPGVPQDQENAMLSVLQAFFRDKNGGTRQERRRREVGRNVAGSEQMYRGYRNWQLHEWRLAGPPEGWLAQLEDHYRTQPVFAVLGGIGQRSWQPVHEFCERNEIPCLFPSVDFPVTAGSGYSSFYFSRGLELEAEVLAKHLADTGQDGGAIVQVFRDDASGRVPARAFRAAMRQRGSGVVIDHSLSGNRPATASFWARLLGADRPKTLILWLDDADIASFPVRTGSPPQLEGIYLSGSLSGEQGRPLQSGDWLGKTRIVYPFELKERRAQHLSRMNVWLRARNIPLLDERVQSEVYFAATIAGDALSHMDENFSRDYFIERIEHMTEQSLFAASYPRLSLGPGQRFASKGGYVTRLARDAGNALEPLGGWIVP